MRDLTWNVEQCHKNEATTTTTTAAAALAKMTKIKRRAERKMFSDKKCESDDGTVTVGEPMEFHCRSKLFYYISSSSSSTARTHTHKHTISQRDKKKDSFFPLLENMLKSKRISMFFTKKKCVEMNVTNTYTYIIFSESELILSTLSLHSPAHPLISNSIVYYLVYFARKRLYNSNENFCGNATITFLPNIILLCTAVAVENAWERKKKGL